MLIDDAGCSGATTVVYTLSHRQVGGAVAPTTVGMLAAVSTLRSRTFASLMALLIGASCGGTRRAQDR